MNFVIFKDTFKRNYKLMIFFCMILSLYLSAIIYFIEPEDMASIADVFGLAEGLLGPLGINLNEFTSPLNYTASVFFGILMSAFTLAFYTIQNQGLLVKRVDDSSIVDTLAMPVKRSEFVIAKIVYLLFSMSILFLAIFLTGAFQLSLLGDFEVGKYLLLVVVSYLLCTFVAMVSFFLSVLFCTSSLGANLSVAVPLTFLITEVIAGVSEDISFLSHFTPFGYLDSVGIVTGEVNTSYLMGFFFIGILVLSVLSVKVFDNKNLPI